MVPVAVKKEVRRQGNLRRKAEGVGGQFVERKSSGILDDDRGALHVGILRLDLVAHEFTLANLGAPSRVLVLNVNHRGIKVLKICKGEDGGVLDQFKCKRHASRWQGDGTGELQALVLNERTLRTQPTDADGVEFIAARGRNLFRLNGDT